MNRLQKLVEDGKIKVREDHYEWSISFDDKTYRILVFTAGDMYLLQAYFNECYIEGWEFEQEISLKDLLDLYPDLETEQKGVLVDLIGVSDYYQRIV